MAINIEQEPAELSSTQEGCIFCGEETVYWEPIINRPVCPMCSDSHEPADIPTAPYNY